MGEKSNENKENQARDELYNISSKSFYQNCSKDGISKEVIRKYLILERIAYS